MGQHIHIDLWVGSMGLPGTHIMRLPVVCSAPMDLQQGYEERPMAVSYTHLTLPTILRV